MSHKKKEDQFHILTERQCADHIQKMRAEGRLPSFEEFRSMVDEALATLDAPGTMTAERKEALLRLLGRIQERAQQRAGDLLPLATDKVQ